MKWGFIELRNPYEALATESLQQILVEYLNLKKIGYQTNYEQILALDIYDYIADHYLIWFEENNKRRIVACMRSIDQATLDYYGVINPCQSLLNRMAQVQSISAHQEYLNGRLNQFKDQANKILYYNGWTIHPDYRWSRDTKLLKRASIATIGLSQRTNNFLCAMGSGMPHLKTDRVLYSLGLKPWSYNGTVLNELVSPGFNSKTTVFIDYDGSFTPEYEDELKFFEEKWNERQIIQSENLAPMKKVA